MLALLAVFLAVAAMPAQAQSSPGTPLSVRSGRLFTTDGLEIAFSRFTLNPDSVSYQSPGMTAPQILPASTVLRVQRQTGSEALIWGVGMGVSGMLWGMLGVSMPTPRSDVPGATTKLSPGAKTGIVVGTTVVSAVIGLAIGAGHKSYTTVYENPSFKRP